MSVCINTMLLGLRLIIEVHLLTSPILESLPVAALTHTLELGAIKGMRALMDHHHNVMAILLKLPPISNHAAAIDSSITNVGNGHHESKSSRTTLTPMEFASAATVKLCGDNRSADLNGTRKIGSHSFHRPIRPTVTD
jgi:hypothetical protein